MTAPQPLPDDVRDAFRRHDGHDDGIAPYARRSVKPLAVVVACLDLLALALLLAVVGGSILFAALVAWGCA